MRRLSYGAFSHDVIAALLVFQNKETEAMLVYQTKPLGIELHFHANFSFCDMKLTWLLVTWVKTLYKLKDLPQLPSKGFSTWYTWQRIPGNYVDISSKDIQSSFFFFLGDFLIFLRFPGRPITINLSFSFIQLPFDLFPFPFLLSVNVECSLLPWWFK